MFKIFQFQKDSEASLYGDFRRIIIYEKFQFPVTCTVFLFLNEKTLFVLFIISSSFYLNLLTILKVLIFQQ